MEIAYRNRRVEAVCEDYRIAVKRYNGKVAEKLFAALEFIRSAASIQDVARHFRRFIFTRSKGTETAYLR